MHGNTPSRLWSFCLGCDSALYEWVGRSFLLFFSLLVVPGRR